MARNDKSVVGTCSYLVIAREHRDRGDPVIIKSRISAWHNLLDCHATLAMTEVLLFLDHSDHPAAARHPSNGGELGTVLFVIARERSDRGDPVIIKSRIRAGIIYWIASLRSQ